MGGERQRKGNGCSLIQARAGGLYGSVVLANDISHEKEAKAGAFNAKHGLAGDAIEAAEDAFVLIGRKPETGIRNTERGPGVMGDREGAADMYALGRVFNGIIEDVEHRSAEIFDDAHDPKTDISGDAFEDNGVRREMVSLQCDGDAFRNKGFELDENTILLAMTLAKLSGFEDLLDGGEEPIGIGEHIGVELLALSFVDGSALESFEIKADAGDRSFELVGDCVEERVLTFVTADFADEKDSVEHDPSDQKGEEDDAQHCERDGAFVEHNPTDIERNRKADEEDAKGDEESDRSSAAGKVHFGSLAKYMGFSEDEREQVEHGKRPGRILAVSSLRSSELEVRTELGSAALVDPETTAVYTPGLSLVAGGTADLAREGNVVRVDSAGNRAVVTATVVGGAGKGLADASAIAPSISMTIAPAVAVAIAGGEFGAAAAVDPDAVVVPAPGLSLVAGGAAALVRESNTAAGIGIAVVSAAVVRGAIDGLSGAIVAPPSAAVAPAVAVAVSGGEFGAAAAVDPDTVVVPAPGLSLNAGRAAALTRELDAAAGVGVAIVTSTIIGSAVDRLAMGSLRFDYDHAGKHGKKEQWQKPKFQNHETPLFSENSNVNEPKTFRWKKILLPACYVEWMQVLNGKYVSENTGFIGSIKKSANCGSVCAPWKTKREVELHAGGFGVCRVELCDLNLLGKAKLFQQPDAIVVHVELIPSQSVAGADRMGMVVVVPAFAAG